MKTKLFYVVFLLAILSSCKKDTDVTKYDDAVLYEQDLGGVLAALQDGPVSFAVDANSAIDFITGDNIWVRCPANAILDADGNVVQGDVELRILYVLTKSDMIRYRAPTMTASGQFLESGGEIFIQAYKDDVPLVFDSNKSFTLNIPIDNPQFDMEYFVGERNADGNVEWELGVDLGPEWGNPQVSEWGIGDNDLSYELLCNRFGWQNIDKFLDNFGEPASDNRVSVSLPAGFGNNNTAAYCILDEFQTVTNLFVDVDNEQFYIEGIPVGTKATICVVATEENDDESITIYAEVIGIEVEANHLLTLTSLTERTAAEIDILLDAM